MGAKDHQRDPVNRAGRSQDNDPRRDSSRADGTAQPPSTRKPSQNKKIISSDWYEQGAHEGQSGSLHGVSAEQPDYDRVAALRKTVEEVTRKPLPVVSRRMGFY